MANIDSGEIWASEHSQVESLSSLASRPLGHPRILGIALRRSSIGSFPYLFILLELLHFAMGLQMRMWLSSIQNLRWVQNLLLDPVEIRVQNSLIESGADLGEMCI